MSELIFDLEGGLVTPGSVKPLPLINAWLRLVDTPFAVISNQGGVALRFLAEKKHQGLSPYPTLDAVLDRCVQIGNAFQPQLIAVAFAHEMRAGKWARTPDGWPAGAVKMERLGMTADYELYGSYAHTWRMPDTGMIQFVRRRLGWQRPVVVTIHKACREAAKKLGLRALTPLELWQRRKVYA